VLPFTLSIRFVRPPRSIEANRGQVGAWCQFT
jgi:hypothetical protein